MNLQELKSELVRRARDEGFDAAGIAAPDAIAFAAPRLAEFLHRGRHGDMEWMATTSERRASPNALWPEVRSVVMLTMNYGPEDNPLPELLRRDCGVISVYARNRDYHDVLKGKLKHLAAWLHRASGADVKVFVDTAPVLEKPLAAAAGLGWQGKHTNLVSRDYGSWLFLGAIFTTAELPLDTPEVDHCGSCRRCLDICPTNAFPAPYQLDARKCISYLTIEHKGVIPSALRSSMGNRIYGCDDCLAVCPWNKYAKTAHELKFKAREDLSAPDLGELAGLDDAAFRARFSGSPIKRIGRNRFVRNVMIALGNAGTTEFVPHLKERLGDDSEEVRAMAIWALARLLPHQEMRELYAAHGALESAAIVQAEWKDAVQEAETNGAGVSG